MASIVTYDVAEKDLELKNSMLTLGYKDHISGDACKVIYFPSTTLYHPTKTTEQVRDEIQATCEKLSIHLLRCVATAWEDWSAICGKEF